MSRFENLNENIRETESSVVTLLSAVAPWLAPLAPAYMTYQHAVGVLDFPVWVALPIAAVVEIMGFSALSTFVEFWFFNRRNQAGYKKAPIEAVVIAFAVYLITIISSNVLLDAFDNSKPIVVTVRAMLAIQTIPAAIIVIVRASHREFLKEIKKDKEVAQANRNQMKLEEQARQEAAQAKQEVEQEKKKVAEIAERARQAVEQARQETEQAKAQLAESLAQAERNLPKPERKPVSDTDLLAYLQATPGASQQQVADHFGVSRQAIGQRIRKLYEVKQ